MSEQVKFEELKNKLLNDLKKIGICTNDFDLVLKSYSKTMYGNYSPRHKRITLYVYSDVDCLREFSYNDLLHTLIHELVHHLQYQDPEFKRIKGVMHNPQFYVKYNYLVRRARVLKLLKKRRK